MRAITKGLLLAAIQLALVLSIGGKLLVDRMTRPRGWALTGPVDPELPIRGRYLSLLLRAPARGFPTGEVKGHPEVRVWLQLEGDQIVAVPAKDGKGLRANIWVIRGQPMASVWEPLAYFIPEHVADPSRRASGEELWVEVTLPRKGSPRPIRLGVKKNGFLTPLDIR